MKLTRAKDVIAKRELTKREEVWAEESGER